MTLREDLTASFEGFWNPPKVWAATRHPVQHMREVVGDGPLYALVVLAALNLVDELDRTAFGILLPTIRDAFGMSDTESCHWSR